MAHFPKFVFTIPSYEPIYLHILCYRVGPSGSHIQMCYIIVWAHLCPIIICTISLYGPIYLHVLCYHLGPSRCHNSYSPYHHMSPSGSLIQMSHTIVWTHYAP